MFDMTSKLAKSQIEQWWSEGLKPAFDDIIKLNNLGLAVERGTEMFDFSACPRAAFLGDNILWEPNMRKRMWIDAALQVVGTDSIESRIYILAYALATSDDELAPLTAKSRLVKAIVKFRDEVLLKCTDTQILAAIDWCMNGNEPDLSIPEEKAAYEVPDEHYSSASIAKQLLLEALGEGMSEEVAQYALLDDLKRMVLISAMNKGADITKNAHTQAAGRFYVASGKIHKRLVESKAAGMTKSEEK